MLITELGIKTCFNPVQAENALHFIIFTLDGMVILFKNVLLEKANLPIVITESGTTNSSFVHPDG